MNFSWFAKVIQKVGASNKNRVKSKIRSNSRRGVRQFLRGFESLEDRRVLAAYSFINNGATLQLNLAANEGLAVTTASNLYTLTLSTGNWSGPNDGRVSGALSPVLSVTDTPSVSIIDGGANTSVTFGSSGVNYITNFTVVLDDPAAGAITFNNPTTFVGSAALSASTSRNIVVNSGANISTVNGGLTLNANQQATGTAGTFTGINVNSATVSTSGTGALSIAGKGGATSGVGVLIRGTGIVETTGASSVTVNGATGASASLGVQLTDTATVRKSTGTGSITLIGDTMGIGATSVINAGTANSVTLRQSTNAVAINLGGADTLAATPVLGLTDAELDRITAATVNIGDANSGAISVTGAISPISPNNFKTLAFGNNTSFAADSEFISDIGPTAAIFEKITVAGTVTIAEGAKLSPVSTGGFVPALLDSFTFVANDLTDAITGTFTLNPPALTAFLGSAFTASSSYAAGTGNDFVIAVPLNNAPTFTMGANPNVNEDSGPQSITGWATGVTAGGDPLPVQTLTFTTSGFDTSLFSTAPSVNPATGTLTFTPALNAFGSTAVILTLQDSGGTLNGGVDTTVKTFSITINSVNDLPVAGNDAAATTELGTTTGSGSVLSNDTDVDPGQTATLVVDVPGTFTGTYGTLTLAADGTFSYTANANQLTVGQVVTDSYAYRARDVAGGLSNIASLVITLIGENDAPVASNDVAGVTEIGTTTGSVFSNDADPDTGETATLVVEVPGTFAGANGTLTLGANGAYSYTANVNELKVGQTVSDSFTYQARDVNGVLSNVATLVVTVTGENDLPVAANNAAATTELGTTTGSGSVLSDDTDADTGETATLVVDAPGTFVGTYGTLTLAADGTFSYTASANQLTVGQTVTDSFNYKARDVNGGLSNTASLVITLTGENDAPVAANDVAGVTEIGTTTGSVFSNDADPDTGETATLVVDVPGTFAGTNGTLTLGANGAYSYTANVNELKVGQTVSDSFTYQARDVNGVLSNVATLVVTVTGENDLPVAANNAAATTELGTTTGSGSVLSDDTDADTGETATLVVDAPGTFVGTYGTLTLAADGTFSYTASANQLTVGQTVTDSFNYKARDVNGGLSNTASLVITLTGENDTPVAANDAGATTEIGTTTGSVLSNDTDPDTGETATLVVDVPGTFVGTNGTLTLGANGAFSYTANANQLTVGQTVSDSFTYQARDVSGVLSNVATLVVTVTGENDVPVAADNAAATTELGTTTGSGSVLSNDTDADTGETATLVVDAPGTFVGTYGTLTLAADGTFSYTASANQLTVGQTVTDSFNYKARDVNGGLSNTASLVITLTGENDTPVAANDAGATTEIGTTTGSVLSNDTDPDTGETATLVVDVPGTFVGTNGTLTLGANGAFSYTANANQLTVGQTVSDSFTYQARDVSGVLSNVATLVVTVTGENDVPVAADNAAATTELGTTTGSGSVLSNDTDADTGETATLVVDAPGTFVGTYGTLTLAADGTFSYTASANQLTVGQTVTDSFNYKARDVNGGLSNTASLVITLTGENDTPVAANDAGATTEIGTTTGSVLSNDTDPDTGETATLVVDVPGTFVGTNGTLTLGANGAFSYTANANQLTVGQTVSDSFTYQARDVSGVLSNVATLVVTVTGENDVPVAADNAAATTELGTTTGSGSVLSNDTDADTGETATLVVDAPGTFVGTYGTLTLAADGTFSYTASANQLTVGQTVTDSFNYKARDVNGGLSNTASLVITLTGENDTPVAANDAGATTEIGTTTGSVLSNDTDPDTGETATLVVDVPGTFVGTNGTLTLGANGAFSYTANANQLTVGQTVSDSFTYQARDVSGVLSNVATLVVTVTGENDVPVAADNAAATTELGTTTGSGSVLSNDTDADTGETATLVVDAPGTFVGTYGTLTLAADGTFSYTASANQLTVGQTVTDSFNYKARDVNGGLSNTASLVITLTGENDTPVAANDAGATTELATITGALLSNDADPDTGETATLVVEAPGTFTTVNGTLTLAANGTYSYTASANQLTVGQQVTDSFAYKARDVNGALSNVATLVITITGENDVPVAANDAAATTELGTTTGSGSVLGNDTDSDTGETATLVVDAPGTFVGTYGTLVLAANGTFSYTANANQLVVGQTVTDSFNYKARDVNGGLSNTASLVITLTGENDAPTAANDAASTTETGTTTGSGSVLSNDTDPDTGESATLVVNAPGTFVGTFGTLTLAANGTFSYVANSNQLAVGQSVTDSFAYQARDVNGALSNTATLVLTITGENDAPVAVDDVAATTETGTTTGSGSVLSNDTDADTGETATLVVEAPGTFVGTYGTLVLAANGTFSYVANANQLAAGQTVTDSFTYKAKDVNGGLSNTASLVVTVTGENDAPTAVVFSLPASVNEGAVAAATITSVSDADVGDTFTYNYVLKKNGVAVQTSGFVSAATFNLTPEDGGPGNVWTVEVQAKDAAGAVSPISSQTLTVNNLPPVLTRANASLTGNVGSTFTNTGTYADVPADTVTMSADVGTIVNNGNGTWSWSIVPATPVSNQVVTITGTDEDGGSSSVTFTFTATAATIATRGVRYLGATGGSASTSLATDKTALLPGQSSTFANYTSYSLGLNGVVVDIVGLPSGTTNAQMLASLQFAQWNGIGTVNFAALPGAAIPTATILAGGGAGGSARVTIAFPDNTVQNTWLQVTVLANAATGLSANDVFYFGNAIGDVGVGNTTGATGRIRVNATDTGAVRTNQSTLPNSAPVTNIYDINRDGRVNATDTGLVRSNQQTLGIVAPITAPSARAAGSNFGGGNAAGRGVVGGAVPFEGKIGKNVSQNDLESANIAFIPSPEQIGSGKDQSTLPTNENSTERTSVEIDKSIVEKSESSKLESIDEFFASLWNVAQ